MKLFIATLLCAVLGLGAATLQSRYPFSAVLLNDERGYYGLHWDFTRSNSSIRFAVNVSTTGWVGFGLSPDGQMTGSDVVIGWVSSDGTGYLHDRYAVERARPPIDTRSQDWFLTSSQEADGFTVLEFYRNFTSCDPQDRDITSSTDRVVWSFNTTDPTSPMGDDALYHGPFTRGQRSLNLIGGLAGPANPINENLFLDIEVTNVEIPNTDTTYWCVSRQLPSQLVSTTVFVTRIVPVITSPQYVHHMLVYLCNEPLSPQHVNASGRCGDVPRQVSACRGEQGLLIGAWAVGGEDFVYPEGIAYPVGGAGQEQYVVIEMHYDNQNLIAGEIDNSGLRFFYTMDEPEQRAGIMFLGHLVSGSMVIPPRTRNFTVTGICATQCTSNFIPEGGIRIIGNNLHTHVVGRKVTLQQFRENECGVLEEVQPIDQNLNYDFNFQQLVHLPQERLVLPGDLLVLNCEYDTMANSLFTIGGESTLEEMCLTFPVFYPRPRGSNILANCVSLPNLGTSFNDFVEYLSTVNPSAAGQLASGSPDPIGILNGLDWTASTELARRLQDSVQNSTVIGFCTPEMGDGMQVSIPPVKNMCPYEAPDTCNPDEGETLTCCEKLGLAGAVQTKVGILGSIMLGLCVLLASIL